MTSVTLKLLTILKKNPVQDYNSLKKYIDMARMGQKTFFGPGK